MTDSTPVPQPQPTDAPVPLSRAARIAGTVCALETVAGLALIVVYVIGLVGHRETSLFVSLSSLLLLVIFTVTWALMTVQWWRGETWPRMLTLVFNLLLLPLSWTIVQSMSAVAGVVVAVVAVVGVVASAMAPGREDPSEDQSENPSDDRSADPSENPSGDTSGNVGI